MAGTLAITTGVYGGGGKGTSPEKPVSQERKQHIETKPRKQATNSNSNTNNNTIQTIPLQLQQNRQIPNGNLNNSIIINTKNNTILPLQPNRQMHLNQLNGNPNNLTRPQETNLNNIGRPFLETKGFTISKNANNTILDLINSYITTDKDFDEFKKDFKMKNKTENLQRASKLLKRPIIYITDTSVDLFNKDESNPKHKPSYFQFTTFLKNNPNVLIILLENDKYYIATPPDRSNFNSGNNEDRSTTITEVDLENQLRFRNSNIQQPPNTNNTNNDPFGMTPEDGLQQRTKKQRNELLIPLPTRAIIQQPSIQATTPLNNQNNIYNELTKRGFAINEEIHNSFYDALKSIESLNIDEEDIKNIKYELEKRPNIHYMEVIAEYLNKTIIVFLETNKSAPVAVWNKDRIAEHTNYKSIERFLEVTETFDNTAFIYKNTQNCYQTVTPPHR